MGRLQELAPTTALGQVTVRLTVVDPDAVREVIRVAGPDRYGTALDASRKFGPGTDTVVIATGANWPDALGGSALAGAAKAPLLLTPRTSLPAGVRDEIIRLGASRAYILGGTAAVGTEVEAELVALLGRPGVVRLPGADRYETARRVADETIRLLGGAYTGDALVATGSNFPDATSGAALAAALGRPILLANATTGAVYVPAATRRVTILGGPVAVPMSVEQALVSRLGGGNVYRAGGATRYETSVLVAQVGIAAGMTWDGVGIATGANFPDALAGGAMLGARSSVLLLTTPSRLSLETQGALAANSADINTLHIFGGTVAVSTAVEDEVRQTTGIF
jgi:putative cell wall-binding protein